jgi:hypothetical protein
MKEALKLALEALELIIDFSRIGGSYQEYGRHKHPRWVKTENAITAIKAALAQQDGQSNFCAQCEAFARELRAVKQALAAQPVQEPVAWALQEDDGQVYDCICNEEHDRHEGRYTVPLYTAPQQRPWVGLTIEEIAACCMESTTTQFEFAQAIEAKLKEKNT